MKPAGKDGKLYSIKEGEAITGGASVTVTTSGFYKIKSIASSSSSLPTADSSIANGKGVKVGQVVHLWSGQALATGDAVIPLTIKLISFVKDVPNSMQGSSTDISTQENIESGVREYAPGAFSESSGTITGEFETDSNEQRELLNNFSEITIDDGTHITRLPAKKKNLDFLLSRRETDTVGETAVWQHFPVIVDSLTLDKPLDGEQPFSFAYKMDGGNNPGMLYYTVKEVA